MGEQRELLMVVHTWNRSATREEKVQNPSPCPDPSHIWSKTKRTQGQEAGWGGTANSVIFRVQVKTHRCCMKDRRKGKKLLLGGIRSKDLQNKHPIQIPLEKWQNTFSHINSTTDTRQNLVTRGRRGIKSEICPPSLEVQGHRTYLRLRLDQNDREPLCPQQKSKKYQILNYRTRPSGVGRTLREGEGGQGIDVPLCGTGIQRQLKIRVEQKPQWYSSLCLKHKAMLEKIESCHTLH